MPKAALAQDSVTLTSSSLAELEMLAVLMVLDSISFCRTKRVSEKARQDNGAAATYFAHSWCQETPQDRGNFKFLASRLASQTRGRQLIFDSQVEGLLDGASARPWHLWIGVHREESKEEENRVPRLCSVGF